MLITYFSRIFFLANNWEFERFTKWRLKLWIHTFCTIIRKLFTLITLLFTFQTMYTFWNFKVVLLTWVWYLIFSAIGWLFFMTYIIYIFIVFFANTFIIYQYFISLLSLAIKFTYIINIYISIHTFTSL